MQHQQQQAPNNEAFNQFCHLSARRMQFFAQAMHRVLTGRPMAGEPAGATPLHEASWIEMRMAGLYRESPTEVQREMAAAEARFRDWPVEQAEALLSDLVSLLKEFEASCSSG